MASGALQLATVVDLDDRAAPQLPLPTIIDLRDQPGRAVERTVAPVVLSAVPRPARHLGKRVLDVTVAATLLVLVVPVLLVTALAIKLHDGGPVLYRQRRVGFRGETFAMLKFRSMGTDADQRLAELADRNKCDGLLFKVDDDPRVTPVGRFIRRTSVDELPQLWQVLRGEMSLVGPRPLPVDPDDFRDDARRRHDVRPGITGSWQVSGGPDLSYAEMVELDLSYVRQWSLGLDLRIMLRTLPALLSKRSC